MLTGTGGRASPGWLGSITSPEQTRVPHTSGLASWDPKGWKSMEEQGTLITALGAIGVRGKSQEQGSCPLPH